MKCTTSVFLLLTYLLQGYAQNIDFSIADPQPVLQEVYGGALLSGDLDNDGDIDLVQSGIGSDLMGLNASAAVFINDGSGNFILQEQNFNDFWSTEQAAMGDFDNDGDLDLIITAENRSDLYRNDGQANFIFDNSSSLESLAFSQMVVGDVDGDGDNDVIQFGEPNTSQFPPIASLFINDGVGVFTPSQSTVFSPFRAPTVEFIDLEGDGDLDVLSFGKNENDEPQVGVYENDGAGNYSNFSNSNIAPHLADEISVGDIDNDGDEDVLITGSGPDGAPHTILYLNDGSGQFIELMDTPFPAIFAGTHAFADLDNDNDLDIVLIGSMAGGLPNIFSIVFENLGDNNFIASDSLGGEYIAEQTIADFNGDGKKDLIIQGFVDDTNVYWNESLISNTREISTNSIFAYPNPTSGQLHIECQEGTCYQLEIWDPYGRLIHRQLIDGQVVHTIEIDAPAGVYVLQMSGQKIIATQKILLAK